MIKEIILNKINRFSEDFTVEIPNENFGDYSTNIALVIARKLGRDPKKLAEDLTQKFMGSLFDEVTSVNGFINFKVKDSAFVKALNNLQFTPMDRMALALIEFGSINPTGPLHIGHARNLVVGDVIASVLDYAGYIVTKEYYVNDKGVQIDNLVKSVVNKFLELNQQELIYSEELYKGDYIADIAKALPLNLQEQINTKELNFEEFRKFCVNWAMSNIKRSLLKLNISYDNYISEVELYTYWDKVLQLLNDDNLLYEHEEATWLKTTIFGDDKDRVFIKNDGSPSYFASDVLYSYDKVKRLYDRNITLLGADHHGYLGRYFASFKMFKSKGEVVIYQLVNLVNAGEKVKMSKRAGDFYTADELIEEVGSSAVRLFFLSRKSDSLMDFDISLAKESKNENPLFYIQYAYARICSLLKKGSAYFKYETLSSIEERRLIKHLLGFNEVILKVAKDLDVHKLYTYTFELASLYHSFYNSCKIIGSEHENSRIALSLKVKDSLAELFKIMKIEALESM